MCVGEDLQNDLKLWARKSLEHCKQSLTCCSDGRCGKQKTERRVGCGGDKPERVAWTVTKTVAKGRLDCIMVNSLNALLLCPWNLHEDGFKSNELVLKRREISRQVNIQLQHGYSGLQGKEQVAVQFVEKNSNKLTTEVKAYPEKEPMTVKKKNLLFCAATQNRCPKDRTPPAKGSNWCEHKFITKEQA